MFAEDAAVVKMAVRERGDALQFLMTRLGDGGGVRDRADL
jgi:hypothetical protein